MAVSLNTLPSGKSAILEKRLRGRRGFCRCGDVKVPLARQEPCLSLSQLCLYTRVASGVPPGAGCLTGRWQWCPRLGQVVEPSRPHASRHFLSLKRKATAVEETTPGLCHKRQFQGCECPVSLDHSWARQIRSMRARSPSQLKRRPPTGFGPRSSLGVGAGTGRG